MLLLGMGALMCSCEKSEVDIGKFEGKWWIPVKGEVLLNGKVVNNSPSNDYVLDYKAYFENGNCTCVDMGDGSTYVLAYSLIDGMLHIGQGIWGSVDLYVAKVTNKEGIVEERPAGGPLEDVEYDLGILKVSYTKEDLINAGKVIDTCNGTDIYYAEGCYHSPYWYYNAKGEAIRCVGIAKEGSIDYWYDTERYYFKAE